MGEQDWRGWILGKDLLNYVVWLLEHESRRLYSANLVLSNAIDATPENLERFHKPDKLWAWGVEKDENGFYDGLDSLKQGGDGDAKISTNDLDTWLEELGEDSVEEYRQTAAANDYGSAFLQDHSAELQTIAERWNDWNGKDDIVSRTDLQKIVDDGGRSDAEHDAARFLLENEGFFNALDTFQKGGNGDGKISTKDFDDWFATIGEGDLDGYRQASVVGDYDIDFYRDNEEALTVAIDSWDDWNGKDDIVSRDDLDKIVDDKDRDESEQEAATLLSEDQGLFAVLDTFKKSDGSDGKISTKDLNAWLETIGVERRA